MSYQLMHKIGRTMPPNPNSSFELVDYARDRQENPSNIAQRLQAWCFYDCYHGLTRFEA
jgi:hypothetical protein